MKTNIFFILTVLFAVQLSSAQVLWSENFDNLALGNVGTDPTGQTPGQGGWHTQSSDLSSNHYFKIVSETGRGKVMELISPQTQNVTGNHIQKRGLGDLWNSRTSGNDVLKIEYDFFTGPNLAGNMGNYTIYMSIWKNNNYYTSGRIVTIGYATGSNFGPFTQATGGGFSHISTQQYSTFTDNTWVKLVIYILTIPIKKIYFSLPSVGELLVHDAPEAIPPAASLIFSAGTNGLSPSFLSFYKFDNLVISAVNNVPLSTNEHLATKFNVFPNPVNDVLTITNSENIAVEEIQLFDISGKAVQSHIFNNENQVQLNIENLASGTYMLHISTNEGTAMKKIIKK